MNFLKRAWLSITRRTGKSILLLAIIFILGNAIAGAISIQQASQNVEKKIKADMGAAATITQDYKKIDEFYRENADNPDAFIDMQSLDPQILQAAANSAYVKYYDYTSQTNLGSESLERYVPQFLLEQEGSWQDGEYEKYYGFAIRGVQFHKVLSIETGKDVLVSGRVFTEQEIAEGAAVALIPKKLADKNGIGLDETIPLKSYILDHSAENYQGMPPVAKEFDVPLKIIGIYDSAPKPPTQEGQGQGGMRPDQWGEAWKEMETANSFIVPNGQVSKIQKLELEAAMEANPEIYKDFDPAQLQPWYEPLYILNDPENLEPFKEEVAPLLPEYYMVATAADNYKTIAAPVEQTSRMAGYVLIVAVAAAILIVTLVILLFLRDRRHELGVYLSLGEKKGSVVGQIVAEVLIIALLGITLSVFTGHFLAQGLSGSMIQAQMEKEAESMFPGGEASYYYPPGIQEYMSAGVTTQDVVSAYQIQLTPAYILVFYLVSLGTLLLSALMPMLYIVRLNPRKILM